VGVIFFSNKIEKFIPPKKGTSHILRIIRGLIDFKPENRETNISEALRYLTNAIKKRCAAFIISDFMDEDFEDAIKIANRKHDLIAIQIYDEREHKLPNVGLVKMKNAETGKQMWVDTSSERIRHNYKMNGLRTEKRLSDVFLKSGVDAAKVRTDQDYVKPLINLFKKRESRR
jgi:uncharacterized protein (DUF58 family)